jgi:hypothetical protein
MSVRLAVTHPHLFLNKSSHSASRAPSHKAASPPSTVQVTAPHDENFYQYDWYWTLVLLVFTQALFLSFFVLAGAYGAYDSDSVLSPSQNPALLFSYILTWITLCAPETTIIYAACHLFEPRHTGNGGLSVHNGMIQGVPDLIHYSTRE